MTENNTKLNMHQQQKSNHSAYVMHFIQIIGEDNMSKFRYLLLCAFMVSIIFLGSAYASEDLNQTDTLNSAQDDANLKITNDSQTFEDIQTEIDNVDDGATIDLGGNFESDGSEILINKSLTINGHSNTTLDGKKSSGFFYLDHIQKLSVNGITFINGKHIGEVTARWVGGYADEYTFTNCVFQSNTGRFLEISSKKATFTGCSFINNENDLFMLDSNELTVKNCKFIKNTDQLISRAKTIDGCSFEENFAQCFDLIDNAQSITNSKFIGNYYMGYHLLINSANAIYNCRFESNAAAEYMIASAGKVDKCVFIKNTVQIFNKCNALKNSRFENNRGDIVASGGSVANCKFIGGKGYNIYIKASSITNSYFKNIKNCYIKGKKLVVKNTDFINVKGFVSTAKIDRCSFSGSDMNVEANSLTNSKFTKNIFEGYLIDAKTIKNCRFTKNKCKTLMLSAKTVINSKFTKNVCKGSLAGISKTASNCKFEKNSFAKGISDAMVIGGKLLKKCSFKSNTGKRGSIVRDANTINGCTFKNNKVTKCGVGTVYFVKKVLNSKFINNKVLKGLGGAIDDVSIVKKCIFRNNYALAGGAINTIGKFTIEKCTFEKNKVKHSASAIFLSSNPRKLNGLIKNCKFSKNKSKGKLNTYDTPYKSYKRGTIFAIGDHKMKITIKKCKGL
ncbi:MAG: hypothetical protein BZ138_07175 [Methanosphaera sp. rholeuAM270]|nr:MAG: hypothetical protein BZ138_07175 [Methanosphaera sp. rholeuAM270]